MMMKELLTDLAIDKLDPAKWIDFPDYGFRQYFLWQNLETGGSVALLDFAEGARVPVEHKHASNQFMYCIEGEYEYTDSNLVLRPGSFYMGPKDHRTARRRRANAIS